MNIHDSKTDHDDLKRAVALLEKVSVTIQISNAIGTPIEWGMKKLPAGASNAIQSAVKGALEKAVDGALLTMRDRSPQRASTKTHKLGVALSGLAGGFFGLPGVLVEIPVTTALMMRAVADVARSEGFDVADPGVQAHILEVFAFGGRTSKDDAADSAYYAARMSLAEVGRHTAAELARIASERAAQAANARAAKGGAMFAAKEAGGALARLIDAVATRLGIVFTEKSAAQVVPVLGAVAAATLNTLFTDHYQDMARGHFTVKRLDAKYGEDVVRQTYQEILARR